MTTFVRDQACILPLANTVSSWVHRSNLHGVAKDAITPAPMLEHIWLG